MLTDWTLAPLQLAPVLLAAGGGCAVAGVERGLDPHAVCRAVRYRRAQEPAGRR